MIPIWPSGISVSHRGVLLRGRIRSRGASVSSSSQATARRRFVTRSGQVLDFTALGFGSAPLGNYLHPLSEADCDATLEAAWAAGLRYYDTAPLYGFGLSEQRVSRLLRQHGRGEYLLSTKVGRLLDPCEREQVNSGFFIDVPSYRCSFDYSYDGVMRSYESSLARIGVDRVDVLFVHDVDGVTHGGRDGSERRIRELFDRGGWRAMAELRDSGAVAAIGAGVNEWQPCARLLELADPDLFLLAGRYTLLEQEPLERFFPECARRGVGIVIGGPYNSGVLAGRSTFNYGDIPPAVSTRVSALDAVCREHGVPLQRAALQFVAAHPLVVSVIPGPQSVAEMTQNVALFGEPIPEALWSDLKSRQLLAADAPVPG
jgi:D-threo-aldose 1-dehydrogenase